MKREYTAPECMVCEVEAVSMMALSLKNESADMDQEVLSKEGGDWAIWSDAK